jgi:catalase
VVQIECRNLKNSYTLRKDDDDWGQAGPLVREVMDDAQRDRLVFNIVGALKNGVTESVLKRAFEYWKNIDKDIGDRIVKGVSSN